jgi:hypothetical protein
MRANAIVGFPCDFRRLEKGAIYFIVARQKKAASAR